MLNGIRFVEIFSVTLMTEDERLKKVGVQDEVPSLLIPMVLVMS